ncbi:FAD-dependent oxidoreductase [Thermoleptolyngbya sichuanensis A183]|uniref:FAD-dependent oxidoreductase n=1 Tax=Thermoleptolyngbya sichuanensis A183 TaxID=2737172 RepID=A0A6M8BGH1_9CYAN|nr:MULTISPECIES: FAD-dependent oxidoreductase [Thermoleptolyngbya]QKD82711.1 FAD-dependent oxidoreductase [Thermoleptolyngbya sichuanensis A183]
MAKPRILIVGGVAGGASCAARARRLSEAAEIIIFDRGQFVSFANCGLPYYVGSVIADEKKLLVANSDLFKQRFNIEVRLQHEVTAIDRAAQTLTVKNLQTGELKQEPYDALVLSPGAAPIRPPLPGIERPGIFALRTIPDSRRIREWIDTHQVKRAVVVGGGFIGLEMAENLVHRGIAVTLIEKLPQVMPPFDPEMMTPVHVHLRDQGLQLCLNDGVQGFTVGSEDNLLVQTDSGEQHPADMVILAIGVRPENTLAKEAGLKLGDRGGIRVNAAMQTSDPHIWAVGDAVEVQDFVTQEWTLIPLAGPANRQGRIAAETILGRDSQFRGVQGTSVCGIFGMTVACTGASEKTLRRVGMDYRKVYLHPGHHAGYFPGAQPIDIKLLYAPADGRILGAQAVGREGTEKRVDVLAMAIQAGMTVFDLEEAELCYAPQFGAAKDPVNMAGMIAANALRGDAPIVYWEDLDLAQVNLVDVREESEFERGHVAGAINVPLSQLRQRMGDLPGDRPLWIYCQVGQRGYFATRTLRQSGFDAYNLTGGFKTYEASTGA